MTKEKISLERARRFTFEWRFIYLFICIMVFIGFEPVQQRLHYLDILLDIIITVILFAALNVVSQHRRQLIVGICLAVPMFVTTWATSFYDKFWLDLAAPISGAVFFTFLAYAIFSFVIRQDHMTKDLIVGAAVVYLLFAIIWAQVYRSFDLIQPGSFYISEQDSMEQGFPYMYFSLVTITTLGYGDIHPIKPGSRTAASLEALIGQIYLVFTVARLVGIYTSQSLDRKKARKKNQTPEEKTGKRKTG